MRSTDYYIEGHLPSSLTHWQPPDTFEYRVRRPYIPSVTDAGGLIMPPGAYLEPAGWSLRIGLQYIEAIGTLHPATENADHDNIIDGVVNWLDETRHAPHLRIMLIEGVRKQSLYKGPNHDWEESIRAGETQYFADVATSRGIPYDSLHDPNWKIALKIADRLPDFMPGASSEEVAEEVALLYFARICPKAFREKILDGVSAGQHEQTMRAYTQQRMDIFTLPDTGQEPAFPHFGPFNYDRLCDLFRARHGRPFRADKDTSDFILNKTDKYTRGPLESSDSLLSYTAAIEKDERDMSTIRILDDVVFVQGLSPLIVAGRWHIEALRLL